VEVLSDVREGDRRALTLHVTLPLGTEAASFEVPPEAHVVSANVQGRPFAPIAADGWLDLAFLGPPEDGLDLTLVTATSSGTGRRERTENTTGGVRLTALAQTRGLPADLVAPLGPRPPDRMAAVGWNPLHASDMTLAAASFDL
jgi:hypothetical protein